MYNSEQVWIFTRDRNPSKNVLKRAYKSLKILGLNGWKLKKADQSCKETNRFNSMSIRRNYEVGGPGPQAGQLNKKSGLVHTFDTAAVEGYDYDNNYRQQHRSRSHSSHTSDTAITTGELTTQMLDSSLKLGRMRNLIYLQGVPPKNAPMFQPILTTRLYYF